MEIKIYHLDLNQPTESQKLVVDEIWRDETITKETIENDVDAAIVLDRMFHMRDTNEECSAALILDYANVPIGAYVIYNNDVSKFMEPKATLLPGLIMGGARSYIAYNHKIAWSEMPEDETKKFLRIYLLGQDLRFFTYGCLIINKDRCYSIIKDEFFEIDQ